MKILVADDDPFYGALIEKMLANLGHGVTVAANGVEAWGACQQSWFDVVVSDWSMPEMSGLELCRKIRTADRKYVYVILVSGMEGRECFMHAMDQGVDDFLPKPIDPDLLQTRLRVAERILALQKEVKQLEMLLPICSYCRKIRETDDNWTGVETYLSRHANTSFSHGICPQCFNSLMEEADRCAPQP